MTGITPELYARLSETLLRCGPFDSDRTLRPLFIDTRLSPWRDLIPESNSKRERVVALTDLLIFRSNPRGENALVLLLQVLRDNTPRGDACHEQLYQIAEELKQYIASTTSAFSSLEEVLQGKYNINISGASVSVIGDNAKIDGGIHFGTSKGK